MYWKKTVVVLIVCLFFTNMICVGLELLNAKLVADDVHTIISRAAILSIKQLDISGYTSAVNASADYDTANNESGYFLDSSSSRFVRKNVLQSLTADSSRAMIYNRVYTKSEFKEVANCYKTVTKRVQFNYTNALGVTSNITMDVPKLLFMGDFMTNLKAYVVSPSGTAINSDIVDQFLTKYNIKSGIKSDSDDAYSFLTPKSLGVTYIDRDLLSSLFVNNMDYLMRYKYFKEGTPLNSEAGGKGILKGAYDSKFANIDETMNPVNDGKFTLYKGKQTSGDSSISLYSGVQPDILYGCVDTFDSKNDSLLKQLFGYQLHGFTTKAEELKAKYMEENSDATIPSKHYITYAKITFYAYIDVPYFTYFARELLLSAEKKNQNLLMPNAEKRYALDGHPLYEYQLYYTTSRY